MKEILIQAEAKKNIMLSRTPWETFVILLAKMVEYWGSVAWH